MYANPVGGEVVSSAVASRVPRFVPPSKSRRDVPPAHHLERLYGFDGIAGPAYAVGMLLLNPLMPASSRGE